MARPTSSPFVFGIGAPRWLMFVALVCWAVLLGPAPARTLAGDSALPGFDSRSSIVVADRSPSLQMTDRRHYLVPGDGNLNPLATGSIAIAATVLSAIQLTTVSFDALAAQQRRSPAQPRAPPADTNRSH